MQRDPTTLPRRAKKIRELSAAMAHRKLTELSARQLISDRIGYLVATLAGAAALHYFGWRAVAALGVWYTISAARAYRRYQKVRAQ